MSFKKLQNGKIVKNVDEQYIRSDLPCGLKGCPVCYYEDFISHYNINSSLCIFITNSEHFCINGTFNFSIVLTFYPN